MVGRSGVYHTCTLFKFGCDDVAETGHKQVGEAVAVLVSHSDALTESVFHHPDAMRAVFKAAIAQVAVERVEFVPLLGGPEVSGDPESIRCLATRPHGNPEFQLRWR